MNNMATLENKKWAPDTLLNKRFKKFFKKNIIGWLILLPSVILFAFFIWEPLLYGIRLSFFETQGLTTIKFNGFQNYIDVITDSVFIKALTNTVTYVLWSLLIGYLVPIIVAIIINEVVHLKSLFKFVIYFPNMVPGLANLLLWSFLLDAGPGGIFNSILAHLKIPPAIWLNNPHHTIALLIVIMTWKSFGATALIYLASLQGVNQELYEAVTLDGAGILARVRYVTIPSIFNIARLLLIMQVIAVFQVLYEPLIMTGGGPNHASETLMLLNYKYAFWDYAFGKATAVGVIVSLILITLTIVYLKVSKENEMV